jgi:hypothetical protein
LLHVVKRQATLALTLLFERNSQSLPETRAATLIACLALFARLALVARLIAAPGLIARLISSLVAELLAAALLAVGLPLEAVARLRRWILLVRTAACGAFLAAAVSVLTLCRPASLVELLGLVALARLVTLAGLVAALCRFVSTGRSVAA